MYSLRSDMYSCMICFFKNKINTVKRGTQKRQLCSMSASSDLRYLRHKLYGNGTTIEFAVKARL